MSNMLDHVVTVVDGRPVTTSLKVAEVFGKQHKHVLDAIRRLEIPEDCHRPNFRPVEYADAKGEKRPMYLITRDGFTLLAMGFTGKKAMQFKLAYIQAFNAMEAELSNPRREPGSCRISAEEHAQIENMINGLHSALNRLQRTMYVYQDVHGWCPPYSWRDVASFCEREELTHVNPKRFFNYYEARRWTIDGQPISDWMCVCRSWDLNAEERMLEM